MEEVRMVRGIFPSLPVIPPEVFTVFWICFWGPNDTSSRLVFGSLGFEPYTLNSWVADRIKESLSLRIYILTILGCPAGTQDQWIISPL